MPTSSDSAISVRGLSKRYRIGGQQVRYRRFTETVTDLALTPFRRLARIGRQPPASETIMALDDVSFDVGQGEVVGIIGRNGAGKSTLLKVLSRITEPTAGEAIIRGRVGSLLEVGTGFHPELSGRENIFLNGAILGMRRDEIRRKFDEIVAFAEVDKFIDTPVKHYSSGMYVRLAFAVAAHLETDILFVDEVLAVGDVQFQKKCLGKMGDVARGGRTVLFVSHNTTAVQALCGKALWLEQGRLEALGTTSEIVARYLKAGVTLSTVPIPARTDRRGNGALRFTHVQWRDSERTPVQVLRTGEDALLEIGYQVDAGRPLSNVDVAVGIDSASGERVLWLGSSVVNATFPRLEPGTGSFEIAVRRFPLVAGRYTLTLHSTAGIETVDWLADAAQFEVAFGDFYGSGRAPAPGQNHVLVAFEVRLAPLASS